MNREIKFRAFRDGFMYDGLSLEKMLSIASKTGFGEDAKTKVEWMQFTGVKDCNANECYEGDIIKIKYTSCTNQVSYFDPKVVRWSDSFCCFNISAGTDFEIIGNIHQNPELLK